MRDSTKQALKEACYALQNVAAAIREDTTAVIAAADHIPLIRHFDDLRLANGDIKVAREALKDMEDSLSQRDIPDLLRNLKETIGLKTPIYLEGVGRVTVSYRFSCTMLDKQLGIRWLDDNGHGDLAQRTVNAQTLGAFAKDMIESQGKELPADIFKTGTAPYTSITKA